MQEPSNSNAPTTRSNSWRALRFVVLFIVIVFALLTGYRYAINTYANQRYLFEVAKNTSWLLNLVGYRSELESPEAFRGNEAAIREEIKALERGERPPAQFPPAEPSESSEPPLTPWEQWHYRALRMLIGWGAPPETDKKAIPVPQVPGTLRDQGPIVHFIMEPSLQQQLAHAQSELTAAQQNGALPEAKRKETVARLQEKVDLLNAAIRKKESAPSNSTEKDGRDFRFKVVPDCGAIEVMAIFVAAVLAFPATWSRRLAGLLLGLPLLYGLNIIRLAFLAFVGALTNGGELFDFAHHFVWQGIYIIFVVALWLAWMEFIVRRKTS